MKDDFYVGMEIKRIKQIKEKFRIKVSAIVQV